MRRASATDTAGYLAPTSRPIDVVFVHAHLGLGGAEVLRVEVLEHLRLRGVRPRVCLLGARNDFEERLEALGIPAIALERSESLYRVDTLGSLIGRLRGWRPDVVHSSQFASGFHARLAAAFGAPQAVVLTEEHGFSRWKRPWHHRVDRLLARRTDAVIAVSEAVRRHCLKHGIPSERVRTLLNPCPTLRTTQGRVVLRESMGLPSDAWVVGTVGTLRWEKAQDVLLQAFSGLRRKAPNAHLVLVGRGPLRGALEDQAAELGLRERVHFLGARRDVADLYTAFDVFAFPSRSEGLGLALLEAMSSGLPVVGSHSGGIPEIVEDGVTGLLVPVDDASRLEATLLQLWVEPDRARELGLAAASYVATHHDPMDYADRLVALYRQLLESRPRSRLTRARG